MKLSKLFAALLVAFVPLLTAESMFAQRVRMATGQYLQSNNDDTLKPGYWLEPGDFLFCVGRGFARTGGGLNTVKLILQSDGNLVLYNQILVKTTDWEWVGNKKEFKSKYVNAQPMWNSGTVGKRVARAVMQTDGNFVLYDTSGKAVWSTGTQGHPNSKLVLQDDANLAIYGPSGKQFLVALWKTGTHY